MKNNALLRFTSLVIAALSVVSVQSQNSFSRVTDNSLDKVDVYGVEEGKNALSLVAEYNTNVDGTFATGDVKEAKGGKFVFEDLFTLNIPEGYHVPSKAELMSISGEFNASETPMPGYPDFGSVMNRGADEEVELFGEVLKLYSHYIGDGKGMCYAIRFKGGDNQYLSAFRWKPITTGDADNDGYKYLSALEVTCRHLGPEGASLTPEEVAEESFWSSNNEKDVVRYFPAAGFDADMDEGIRGRYWSKTPKTEFGAFSFGFDSEMAYILNYTTDSRFSLRLFKDSKKSGIQTESAESGYAEFYYNGEGVLAANRCIESVRIFDVSGKMIFEDEKSSSRYFVNLSKGIYIINYKLTDSDILHNTKLIVK